MTAPTEVDSKWPVARLKDVTADVPSWDPSTKPHDFFTYVDISSIDNQKWEIVSPKRLLGSDAPSRARRPIINGDVLFSNVRTYLRNVAQVSDIESPAVASTGFTLLRPKSNLSSRYLYHLVRSGYFIDRVTPEQTGTHYPATSDRVVREQLIPLPEPALQEAIAGLLDGVEVARQSAATHIASAQRAIERFRQAVITAACSGRLTADWRTHYEPNESSVHSQTRLLELRRRTSKKQPLKPFLEPALPNIPAEWQWSSADSLMSLITKGTTPSSSDMNQGDGEIPYLKVYNLTFDGNVDFTVNPTFVPRLIHEGLLKRSRVYPGDLLLNIVGPPLGKVGVVPNGYPEWNINQAIAVLRPIEGVNADFIKLWLLSPPLLSHLARRAKATAGQYNLTLEICRELPIPTPPPEEQAEIVRRVDRLLQAGLIIKQRIVQAGTCVDDSMDAILTKAFRGELVLDRTISKTSITLSPGEDG